MDITFTNTKNVPEEYGPKPSSSVIPSWYKEQESYLTGDKVLNDLGEITTTVKKCMPVFDAITSGYILFTWTDVFVQQKLNDNGTTDPHYYYPSFHPISFHPISHQLIDQLLSDLKPNSLFARSQLLLGLFAV